MAAYLRNFWSELSSADYGEETAYCARLWRFSSAYVEVSHSVSPDGRGTTVPYHAGRDISPILLRQIAKDIDMTVDELIEYR
jgi:hypothetical protein